MATEWGKIQASQPEVTKRVQAAPVMSRPGARTSPKDPQSAAYAAAKHNAKKSGYSDDSAAALAEQILSRYA
jgi:hypothetical protein